MIWDGESDDGDDCGGGDLGDDSGGDEHDDGYDCGGGGGTWLNLTMMVTVCEGCFREIMN